MASVNVLMPRPALHSASQRSSTVLHSEPPGQLLEHSSNVIILVMATDVAFDTSMVSIVPQTPPAIC